MTTNELYKLLRENNFQETERLEFKREFPKNAGDLCKSFAAFANGNGGVFLIGVEDKDGEVVGIKNSDETMRRVTSALRDSIRPSIHPEIGSIDIGGAAFVVWAKVSADPSVHFCNEKIYTRVGSETRAVIDEHALLRLMNRGSAEASRSQSAASASSPSPSAPVFSEPPPFGIDAHLLKAPPIKSDEVVATNPQDFEVKGEFNTANAEHQSVSTVVPSEKISASKKFGQNEQSQPIDWDVPTESFSASSVASAPLLPTYTPPITSASTALRVQVSPPDHSHRFYRLEIYDGDLLLGEYERCTSETHIQRKIGEVLAASSALKAAYAAHGRFSVSWNGTSRTKDIRTALGQVIGHVPYGKNSVELTSDIAQQKSPADLANDAAVSPITYKATRLLFRASVIEPLLSDEAFRIVTPDGTFQMTKAEFYRDFANVVASASYRENGIYHSKTVPKKAFPYRVE